jgi:predicted ATPase/DNA-binding winged helix-turn-helix (wHTH) protein
MSGPPAAPTPDPSPRRWRFGAFVLDDAAGRLLRDGTPVDLPPRPFALLVHLVRHAGRLVTKDELLDSVWGTPHITEGVIKTAISALRVALDDDPKAPRWLETVPRRGYRFVGVALAEAAAEALAPAAPRPCCNLPERLPALIGRDDELARLLALLRGTPWVTLTGPGGVGKTTLARVAAQALSGENPDGGWFVELAPLAPESAGAVDVCRAIAMALQLPEQAAQSVAALAEAVRPFDLLLVLDNAEHLREPVAEVVAALLARAPRVRLLVTSQAVIGLPGETVLALGPLALPAEPGRADDVEALRQAPALQLFAQRVADKLPGFTLSHRHADAAVEVCRVLDGLPLALELAAARVPLLGLHGLAERLRDDARLPWLSSPTRLGPERQRSLAGTVAWSCAWLTPPQQRLLSILSVFRGAFTLDAATALAAVAGFDPGAVPDTMAGLLDRSLLLSDPPSDGTDPPRHRMLEGVREFAGQRLDEHGEREAVMRGLLAAEVAHWRRAEDEAQELPTLRWIARHQPELNHLRAALSWALGLERDGAGAVRLLGHTGHAWQRLGVQQEGARWYEAAVVHLDAVPDLERARFVAALALQAAVAFAPSSQLVRKQILWATDTLFAAGDARAAATAAHAGFHVGERSGLPDLARASLERQARYTDPAWSDLARRQLRWNQAYAQRVAGDAAAYERAMRDELDRCRRHGALLEAWIGAQGLVLALLDQDRLAEALAIAAPALTEMRAHRMLSRYPAMAGLWLLMLARDGRFDALPAALAEMAPVLESAGTGFMLLPAAALLAEHEGRPLTAARLLGHYGAQVDRLAQRGRAQGFLHRLEAALGDRLAQALGGPAVARAREEGASLLPADARALALQRP